MEDIWKSELVEIHRITRYRLDKRTGNMVAYEDVLYEYKTRK